MCEYRIWELVIWDTKKIDHSALSKHMCVSVAKNHRSAIDTALWKRMAKQIRGKKSIWVGNKIIAIANEWTYKCPLATIFIAYMYITHNLCLYCLLNMHIAYIFIFPSDETDRNLNNVMAICSLNSQHRYTLSCYCYIAIWLWLGCMACTVESDDRFSHFFFHPLYLHSMNEQNGSIRKKEIYYFIWKYSINMRMRTWKVYHSVVLKRNNH